MADMESLTTNCLGCPSQMQNGFNGRNARFSYHIPEGSPRGLIGTDSAIGSDSDARCCNDDYEERMSTSTDITSVSRQQVGHSHRRRCSRKRYRQQAPQYYFGASLVENSVSTDIVTLTLNLDVEKFLGISVIGRSSQKGDDGIYVDAIMKGSAVALDGRMTPGDRIIQVNDILFDSFTNDQAVDVLRGLVANRGLIKLTVAKTSDDGSESGVSAPPPNEEPVHPIGLQAWLQHANSTMRSSKTVDASPYVVPRGISSTSSLIPLHDSAKDNLRQKTPQHLSTELDKKMLVKIMAKQRSGLEIKDRIWLNMVVPKSFLGADLVSWLLERVVGISDRKEAREFANELLNEKLIAHYGNRSDFTEHCYYMFTKPIDDNMWQTEQENEVVLRKPQFSLKTPARNSVTFGCRMLGQSWQRVSWPYNAMNPVVDDGSDRPCDCFKNAYMKIS